MIDATQLTKELEGLSKKAFSPEITQGLEKAANEFKALNTEMVGRLKPQLNEVSKALAKEAPKLEALAGRLAGDLSGPLEGVRKNLVGIGADLKSGLPRAGLELNNGLKGISSVLDDFPKEVEEGLPKFLKAATTVTTNLQHALPGLQKPLAEMADGLPAVAAKLKPELESAASTISNAITGSEVKNAFNNIALTLPTPQAIAEVTNAMGQATKNLVPALEAIKSSEIETVLTAQLNGIQGDLAGVTAELSGVLSQMKIPDLRIPNIGNIINENLSGLTAKLNTNIGQLLNTVTGSPILDALHDANQTLSVMKGTLGVSVNIPGIDKLMGNVVKELTNGTVAGALDILQKAPNLGIDISANIPEFESKIATLQSQFGSAVAMLPDQLGGLVPTNIISQAATLAKSQPVLNNAEEVFAEAVTALKQPKALEVSWTETYKDEVVNKDTIKPKNYYHYIVLPNGITQRDRPVGNDETIRVAVVGGYNVFKGEKGVLTSESITHSQTLAVKRLMEQTAKALPGINFYGKGEFVTEGGRGGGSIDPGIDIDKIAKSIDGRSSKPPESPVAPQRDEDLGKPIGPRVVYQYGTEEFQKRKIRNRLIQPSLMRILDSAATQTGLYVTIFSGGQMPRAEIKSKGGSKSGDDWYIPGQRKAVATGSVRHDNGYAADVWLYTDPDRKNRINASVWKNPPREALNFIRACKALGARSVGVGPGYMEPGIHVDLNTGLYWGAKGLPESAPQWLRDIMA